CLLLDIQAGGYLIQYPETGSPVEINAAELHASYSGVAGFVKPLYRFDERTPKTAEPRGGHWFWSVIFENRRLYRDALISAVLINIFALVMPLFTMNVYDRVVPNNATETMWVLAIGIAIVLIFNFAL